MSEWVEIVSSGAFLFAWPYRHSLISVVSIPAIFDLTWFIIQWTPGIGVGVTSECMGKTFQAATTNTWELFDPTSLLQNIFLISAKLNFHRPLVCSTICRVQYYTPEVWGSSVWQIPKKYFAAVIYGQKALMC